MRDVQITQGERVDTEDIVSVQEAEEQRSVIPRWYRPGIAAVLLISLFLNFFLLGRNGFDNVYYAAGVKSMLMNWHNFFFVSSDPSGFVTLDKPPVAFWIQVAFARVFGFTPWSVLCPQALAGTLSVAVLAHLMRRSFGPLAALLAALALTLTPISIATDRSMTMDSILVLVLLLAAWVVSVSVERGKVRFLLLGAVLIGIGFNVKMLDAYLILPALGILYWFSAPHTRKARLGHLAVAAVVMLVISLSWCTIVDLTPVAQRPFVGSSASNSELQLALFYNGTMRVIGGGDEWTFLPTKAAIEMQQRLPAFARYQYWLGTPGLFRLLIAPLGQQIGWLLPLSWLGLVAVKWHKPTLWPLNREQQGLALWGVWFLTQFIFFSSSSFTHQYYVIQVAPALCALLAMGVVMSFRSEKNGTWRYRRYVLPLALLVTACGQLLALTFTYWQYWPIPLVGVALAVGAFFSRITSGRRTMLLTAGVCVLFVIPLIWSAIPVFEDRTEAFPYAGPAIAMSPLQIELARSEQGMEPDDTLMAYLLAHQGTARYVMATSDSSIAAPVILKTGRAVMTLGGYAGRDQILSLTQLKQQIASGSVRYFVFAQTVQEADISAELKAFQRNYSEVLGATGQGDLNPLVPWIRVHCPSVPQSAWHVSSAGGVNLTLLDVYDCRSQK